MARQVAVADVTLERFQQIPLTERLTKEQVEALLPHVEERRLSKGETLFRRGAPAASVFFVEKGKVAEVERGPFDQRIVHRRAGPGEYLGRYALVTGRPFRVSAVAEEDSVLLAISLRYLQPLLFAHEDWRSWFLRTDIAARLRAVPLLIGFDDWDIYRLADAVEIVDCAPGDTIFNAGDEAESFYIVDQGQVIETPPTAFEPDEDWPRYFGPGNYFGRYSLEHGQKRRVAAIARLPTRLFCIPGQTMKELLADRAEEMLGEQAGVNLQQRLQQVSMFSRLPDEQLRLLAGYVSLEYHRPGDIVARQGEPATSLMILQEGEAVVRLQIGRGQPRPVTHFKAYQTEATTPESRSESEGNYFGAHALLADEMRGATVEVTRPSIWIVLRREEFQRFLADAGLRPQDLHKTPRVEAKEGAPPPTPEGHLPLPYKVRRHWIIPATQILPLAVFMVLVLILIGADVTSELSMGLRNILMWGGIFLLVVLAAWTVYRYADWLNDAYEVTTEAVIHTEKKLFLSEQRYEIPLYQIQNVNIFVEMSA
jgi:CRP-like cAMP-binding protein